MAVTNYERVGKAMELLKAGLAPFVEREFRNQYGGRMLTEANRMAGAAGPNQKKTFSEFDIAAFLKLMSDSWNEIFRQTLGQSDRSLVFELKDARNDWAHQNLSLLMTHTCAGFSSGCYRPSRASSRIN
jgi:hypothetical protein